MDPRYSIAEILETPTFDMVYSTCATNYINDIIDSLPTASIRPTSFSPQEVDSIQIAIKLHQKMQLHQWSFNLFDMIELANYAFLIEEFDYAEKQYTFIKNFFLPDDENEEHRIHGCLQLAQLYDRLDEPQKAGELFIEALAHIESGENVSQLMYSVVLFQKKLGNFKYAREILRKRLERVDVSLEYETLSGTYLQLGIILDKVHRHSDATEAYKLAVDWAKRKNDHESLAYAYQAVAVSAGNRSNWIKSIEFFEKALQTFVELDDEFMVEEMNKNIVKAHQFRLEES